MSTEPALTQAQRDDLRTVAAMIIPDSREYKVPGADDAEIQADILVTLDRDTKRVREALDHLARLAGKPLAELDPARREVVAKEFRSSGGAAAATLTRVVLQCYYRDDRVRALARAGAAAAVSEGLSARAGRLVAARSREGAAPDVAAGAVGAGPPCTKSLGSCVPASS